MKDEIGPVDDLKRRVVLKKRAQKIGLVPTPLLSNHPAFGVFKRIENVVHVNQHSGPEDGQNPEQIVVHIAAGLADMRRIQEENIVGFQLLEYRRGDILQLLWAQVDARGIEGSEKLPLLVQRRIHKRQF